MTTPTYPNFASAIDSIPSRNWRDFLRGYVECMSWCGTVLPDDPDCAEYPTPDSIAEPYAPEVWATARAECVAFCEEYSALLEAAHDRGVAWDYLGHDLWLTRNGHGAGFWDRGLGELGQLLTRAAKSLGECDGFYVGDDGYLHHVC